MFPPFYQNKKRYAFELRIVDKLIRSDDIAAHDLNDDELETRADSAETSCLPLC